MPADHASNYSPPQHGPHAVVLGAGVLGLSIATELVSRGYRCTVVAKDLPEDVHSQGFASPWAGCNWCSFASRDNLREQEWDRVTYERLGQLAADEPDLCEMIPFFEGVTDKVEERLPWFDTFAKDFKILKDAAEVPGEWPEGYIYSSYVLNAPLYLQHLHKNLVAKGVPVIRKRITSLDELYNLPEVGPVDTVINASGLGARSLLGVEDREAYPIRGQTVLVRSDVKVCLMGTVRSPDKGTHKKPSESFYIIPRPGSANAVIVGGCFQEDNFDPMPDYALAQRILERAYAACPELAGPNGQLWRDIEIISHNVGFRPARHGGCRLELEERDLGVRRDLAPRSSEPARKVAVLHCYGIGPAGYQASLGLAKEAADIFERHRAALN